MRNGVIHGHTLEVVNLAAAQDGGQYLVLLGGGEDEDDVGRRLLQGLEERVECRRRQHVNLVDNKDLVAPYLRRYARLLHQRLDMLHRVIRGGIELEDVERTLLVERLARLTLVAGLAFSRRRLTVDGLGEDTRTSGLAHTSRPAKEVRVGQFARAYRVLQRCCQCLLSHHRVERHWSVLSRRNNIFFHIIYVVVLICECKDTKNPPNHKAKCRFFHRLT